MNGLLHGETSSNKDCRVLFSHNDSKNERKKRPLPGRYHIGEKLPL